MTRTAATPLRPVPQPSADIAIDDDIPIPSPGGGARLKYPFHKLVVVGKSFRISCEAGDALRLQMTLAAASRNWAKRQKNGWTFRTQQDGDGVRIWRTA